LAQLAGGMDGESMKTVLAILFSVVLVMTQGVAALNVAPVEKCAPKKTLLLRPEPKLLRGKITVTIPARRPPRQAFPRSSNSALPTQYSVSNLADFLPGQTFLPRSSHLGGERGFAVSAELRLPHLSFFFHAGSVS